MERMIEKDRRLAGYKATQAMTKGAHSPERILEIKGLTVLDLVGVWAGPIHRQAIAHAEGLTCTGLPDFGKNDAMFYKSAHMDHLIRSDPRKSSIMSQITQQRTMLYPARRTQRLTNVDRNASRGKRQARLSTCLTILCISTARSRIFASYDWLSCW